MQFNRNKGTSSARIICLLSSIVSFAAVQAGDKINFSEPVRKTELPKAGPKFEELSRSYEFLDKGSEGAAGSLSIPASPIQPVPSAANMRKIEELIDKKKNWIFETPKDSSSRESILGGDKEDPYDSSSRRLSGRSESVMENFFNERDEKSKKELLENRRSNAVFEPGTTFFGKKDQEYNTRINGDNSPNMEFNLNGYLRNDYRRDDDRGLNGFNQDQSPYSSRLDNLKNEKKIEREREEELRQAEFQKLLQPRSLTPSVGGTVDIINRQIDSTRQEANPIAPRGGYNSPLMGSRSEPTSSLPGSAASSRPALSGPSVAETLRVQNPMVNPLKSSGIAPAQAAPSFTPAPFVLDIQRRKF